MVPELSRSNMPITLKINKIKCIRVDYNKKQSWLVWCYCYFHIFTFQYFFPSSFSVASVIIPIVPTLRDHGFSFFFNFAANPNTWCWAILVSMKILFNNSCVYPKKIITTCTKAWILQFQILTNHETNGFWIKGSPWTWQRRVHISYIIGEIQVPCTLVSSILIIQNLASWSDLPLMRKNEWNNSYCSILLF